MIPERYKRVRIENSKLTDKEKKIIKDVIENKKSLLLTGRTGTGKTHFAGIIFNIVRSQECGVGSKNWFDVNEYIVELKNRQRAKTTDAVEYLQEWWNKALWCDLLVFDDLGAEEDTEEAKSIVKRILMSRYNHQKWTILTTNLNGEQLKNRYSERLISRIYEDYLVVVMNGKDRRKEKFGEVIKI